MKEIEIEKSETRERRGRSLNLKFHTNFTLFITILIGLNLNYPTFLFYMSGQKDIFLFGTLPALVYTVRNLKVVYP